MFDRARRRILTLPAFVRAQRWLFALPSFARAAVFSVLLAAVLGFVVGWHDLNDYSHAKGHPSEKATITGAVRVSGVCPGPHATPRYDVAWHSLDPPVGLPVTFTQEGSCADAEVGDTHRVVRVVHADGSLSVYLDPPASVGGALVTVLGVFGGVLAFGTVVFGLIDRFLGRGAAAKRDHPSGPRQAE